MQMFMILNIVLIIMSSSALAAQLLITPKDFGSSKIELDLLLDHQSKRFQFDTAGKSTSLAPDKQTLAYPSLGKSTLKGASGIPMECDVVQPERIFIDSKKILRPVLNRCDFGNQSFNNLGLDLLDKLIFDLNFRDSQLKVLSRRPSGFLFQPLIRLPKGHIKIPVGLDKRKTNAIFDTGWLVTSVDSRYVEQNHGMFKFLKKETGVDIGGNPVTFNLYEVASLSIGNLSLNKVIVSTFDFGDDLRNYFGSDAPIILGTNVIAHANWIIDLKSNLWNIQNL